MQIGLQMRNLVATTTQNSAAIFGPLEVVEGLKNPLSW